MSLPPRPVVLAAVAHPDDIEFLFSGTLLLLREQGCPIHMWNLANGSCGTLHHSREVITQIRAEEAKKSALLAEASIHAPLFEDLAVFYNAASLAAVSARVREIRPQIILTHAPDDYMEDHQNVCRLITTAAFSRSMPNYQPSPPTLPYEDAVRIYHAPPHGLHNQVGEVFRADVLFDVSSVMELKGQMLECHQSQFQWLDDSQGMKSPIDDMQGMCRTIASWSEGLEFAEAWRRHSHLGFCVPEFDPLPSLLDSCFKKPTQPQ